MTTAIFTLEINAASEVIDNVIQTLEFCDISYAISRGNQTRPTILSVSAEVPSRAGAQEILEMVEALDGTATVLAKNW